MNKKMTTNNINWNNLPTDLLEFISSKLSIFDTLNFMAVCSSWHVAGQTVSSGKTFPLLIFYTDCHPKIRKISKIDNVCFASISHKESAQRKTQYHNIRRMMVGSRWLVLLDENRDPYLLKLLPYTRIQLPKIKQPDMNGKDRIFKALLSINNNQDLIVMVRYPGKLAFWKPGNEEWTTIGNKGYCDIALYDDTFYALKVTDTASGMLSIEAWDLGSLSPENKLNIDVHWEGFNTTTIPRLIISPMTGEILIVSTRFLMEKNPKWMISKVDLRLRQCIKVKSLNGGALLLGVGCNSVFVSSNDVKDYGYKPNSIYSLDYWIQERSQSSTDFILSNYCIQDGKFQEIRDSCRTPVLGFALIVLSIKSLHQFLAGPL